MLAARLKVEIVIERRDAVNLGAGNIQRIRDQGQRLFGQVSKLCLKGVQDRQRRPFLGEVA